MFFMNNVIVNQYIINSPLFIEKHRVAFLSDVHGDIVNLVKIIDILKKMHISVILLGGDLIDTNKDDIRNDMIMELLKELSITTKLFFSIGNHDLVYFQNNSKGKRCEVESEKLVFWKHLNFLNKSNIFLPSLPIGEATINKWSLSYDIDVTSFNLPINYYWNKELYDDFDNYLDIFNNNCINTEKFNILLCHSPKGIIRDGQISDYLDYLKKFNLILSGHMHGGLVPECMRNYNSGGGLVGPYASILPKHAYGVVKNDNTISLTSAGVTKIARSSEVGLFSNNSVIEKIIDFVYPPEVEIIDFIPGNKTMIKKLK